MHPINPQSKASTRGAKGTRYPGSGIIPLRVQLEMDSRACELLKEGRERGICPASVDQQRVVQADTSGSGIGGPFAEYKRYNPYATQPGWRGKPDLA